MTWFRCGGGGSGIPAALKNRMNAVFNKKFGTAVDYPAEGWPDDVNLMGVLQEKTIVSSPIADFSDGADDVPTKSLVVTISPTLSGVSSVSETQTGKNLIKPDKYQTAGNNLALGQNDGTSFGTFLKAGTYTISYTTTGDSCYIYRREENDHSNTNMGKKLSTNFTIESDGNFRFWLYGDGAVSANISNVQIELGSTAHAYEPYTAPTQYTASLGRTINGGEVDIVNGTGTDGYGIITFDGSSDENWGGYSAYNGYYIGISDMKSGTRQDGVCNQLTCSKSTAQGQTDAFWLGVGNARLYVIGVYDSMGSTLEAFKAYLSENPLILVYPLETPTDFTFTGQEINTRLGYNAFWADSGDTEVTYRSSGTIARVVPTLISKTITENGSYQAADDQADGYSEVVVNVPSVTVTPINSSYPFLIQFDVSGTNVERVVRSITAPSNGKYIFAAGSTCTTNTNGTDGFFEIRKNSTSIVKQYMTANTTTAISIPDIDVSASDEVKIIVGFDNYHTSCEFRLYTAISFVSEEVSNMMFLSADQLNGAESDPDQTNELADNNETEQEGENDVR